MKLKACGVIISEYCNISGSVMAHGQAGAFSHICKAWWFCSVSVARISVCSRGKMSQFLHNDTVLLVARLIPMCGGCTEHNTNVEI